MWKIAEFNIGLNLMNPVIFKTILPLFIIIGGMDGTLSMKVCTLSFPNYGFMLRKLQENTDREKAFREEMLRRAMVSKPQKEDIQVK